MYFQVIRVLHFEPTGTTQRLSSALLVGHGSLGLLVDGEYATINGVRIDILWSQARLGSAFVLLLMAFLFSLLLVVLSLIERHAIKKKSEAFAADIVGCVNVPMPANLMEHRAPTKTCS